MLRSELVFVGDEDGERLRARRPRAPTRVDAARTVRITASEAILRFALVPRLGELVERLPGLTVTFRSSTRWTDLSRVDSDIAVRMSPPTEAALTARRFGAFRFGLYASPTYLARHGTPRRADDLAGHAVLGLTPLPALASSERWTTRLARDAVGSLESAALAEHLPACLAGRGIALLASLVAGQDPRLVPVLARLWPPPREAWVVTHQRARTNPDVDAVVAWMVREGIPGSRRPALAAVSSGATLE